MLQNSLKKCPDDVRVYVVPMPPRIQSYVVLKDGYYTICINDTLCRTAQMKAYRHELDHIQHGDFASGLPADLLEIRAHCAEKCKEGYMK